MEGSCLRRVYKMYNVYVLYTLLRADSPTGRPGQTVP
jgi:hypothetical protein